jgi:hypothetical protein
MYFPKSQITPNLYTNGGEFTISSTQENYTGYYYKTSSGKYYTGRNPSDLPNTEIILNTSVKGTNINNQAIINNTSIIVTELGDFFEEEGVLVYLNLKNIDPTKSTLLPTYTPTYPSSQDYEIGEFRRFFCKKTNEIQYIEIDPKQYSLLAFKDPQILWQLYYPFNIPWTISGRVETVINVNKNIVELTMKQLKLPRFNDYLKNDYVKYLA